MRENLASKIIGSQLELYTSAVDISTVLLRFFNAHIHLHITNLALNPSVSIQYGCIKVPVNNLRNIHREKKC